MSTQTRRLIIGLVIVVVLWAASAFVGTGGESGTTLASNTETASVAEDPVAEDPVAEDPVDSAPAAENPVERFSDLPTIAPSELPLEAIDTLGLIAAGGPFPFRQDDTTFQNREELLPDHPLGHYREYTVITPGEGDRGARRIVSGADGELYYTADHYDSFREVLLDGGAAGQ